MNDKNTNNYGVITEQGDLGLGFSVLNNNDKKKLDEADKRKKNTENNKDKR